MTEKQRQDYDRQESEYVSDFNRGYYGHVQLPKVVHPVYVSDGKRWVRKEEYEARKTLKPKRRKRRKSA